MFKYAYGIAVAVQANRVPKRSSPNVLTRYICLTLLVACLGGSRVSKLVGSVDGRSGPRLSRVWTMLVLFCGTVL